MESKEEVHSDDGSYELINLEDYGSETDHLNTEADASGSMDVSDDGSYDLLCSEVSETLVLTEDEAFYDLSDKEMKSLLSESAKGDMDLRNETDSDHTDGNLGFKSANGSVPIKGDMGIKGEPRSDTADEEEDEQDEEVGYMGFDFEMNSDSKVQSVPARVNKGKKRNLMTMLYESSSLDYFEFPAQIKLQNDIKAVAKHHITRYLPAKSLFKYRQVSKEWNQWISSPFFTHMQSHHFRKTSGFFQNSKSKYTTRFISLEHSAYGVPYPSLAFLPKRVFVKCSCNGLLLCKTFDLEDEFYICNPVYKQWVKLPPSSSYHGVNPKFVLAFEPSFLNFELCYQVICLYSTPYPDMGPIVQFDIYDSKTKSWRVPDMMCSDLESDVKSDGIFLNGVAYWETQGGELLAYDLTNDMYSVQRMLFYEGGALTNFNGELCYVRAEYDHAMKSCTLDVYGYGGMLLKNTINVAVDDVEDGEFVDCTVLGNSCGDVVALVVKVSQGQKRLFVYHVKDEKVEGPVAFNHSKKLFPYVNSLVSLQEA